MTYNKKNKEYNMQTKNIIYSTATQQKKKEKMPNVGIEKLQRKCVKFGLSHLLM